MRPAHQQKKLVKSQRQRVVVAAEMPRKQPTSPLKLTHQKMMGRKMTWCKLMRPTKNPLNRQRQNWLAVRLAVHLTCLHLRKRQNQHPKQPQKTKTGIAMMNCHHRQIVREILWLKQAMFRHFCAASITAKPRLIIV